MASAAAVTANVDSKIPHNSTIREPRRGASGPSSSSALLFSDTEKQKHVIRSGIVTHKHLIKIYIHKGCVCVQSFLSRVDETNRGGLQQSPSSPGDNESRCVRRESPLGGVQLVVLLDERAEGGHSLGEKALLHSFDVQVVVQVGLQGIRMFLGQ